MIHPENKLLEEVTSALESIFEAKIKKCTRVNQAHIQAKSLPFDKTDISPAHMDKLNT